MKKYKITYISSTDDDCCSVWVSADSPEEAKQNVKREYWDIKEIVLCNEIK